MKAIDEHALTITIGPAGTGKTYLAVSKAVEAFTNGHVARIVITRPVVEAGESLGFLPGDINEKMDPGCARSTTPSPIASGQNKCDK